jgi:hypothetical protein
MKHKWHKEICAWADGAEIEMYFRQYDGWSGVINPTWDDDCEYRIKPQPKEPQYLYFFKDNVGNTFARTSTAKNSCDTYIGKIKLEVDDD